jgi:hypothetical protein
MTKREHEAIVSEYRKRETLLLFALRDEIAGAWEWEEHADLPDGWTYTFRLARAKSASGGYVLIEAECRGQAPSYSVEYLEVLRSSSYLLACYPNQSEIWAAVARLASRADHIARAA